MKFILVFMSSTSVAVDWIAMKSTKINLVSALLAPIFMSGKTNARDKWTQIKDAQN